MVELAPETVPKKKREKVVYERVALDFPIAEAIGQNDLTWFLRQFSKKQVRDSLANEFFAKKRIPKAVWIPNTAKAAMGSRRRSG